MLLIVNVRVGTDPLRSQFRLNSLVRYWTDVTNPQIDPDSIILDVFISPLL